MKYKILCYDTLPSTSTLALEFAKAGAEQGTVITADYQTSGRGRFKRRWVSPSGAGLLFSIILRPHLKTSSVSILTHLAAGSVAEALKRRYELDATLKKPNDVLVGGKKIAGILTEASAVRQRVEYVVVGIGVNVNGRSKQLVPKATSIYRETGKKADQKELLNDILEIFKTKYHCLNGKPHDAAKD